MPETTLSKRKRYRVYRNLNNGKISVKEVGGNVCGWVEYIHLHDVKLVVNEKGRDRVREEQVKNVHAYVEGYVYDYQEFTSKDGRVLEKTEDIFPPITYTHDVKAYYNPYTCDFWTGKFSKEVLKPSWNRATIFQNGDVYVN